jgi:DNA-binding response OmpR family regulator
VHHTLQEEPVFQAGSLTIDFTSRVVRPEGKILDLTATEN